ncbi:unnamed protein product [Schistosoma rodhaini]|nr:unnamed protein product [Schistosoma rodhaini]
MVCARALLDPVGVTSMASDKNVEQGDHIIVSEFCHLLEKSKQLFNGLRDLPQHGHRQWKVYFGRTFDVYTKLWKFQQQHRQKLDELYGLKRWQIGEVASKIGQLYHHYYLRTSDLHYLNESFAFFSAIRTRDYYSKANKEEKPDLMIKKLRYYARFILVCLLLGKMKLANELIREFSKQVDEYIDIYDADDHLGWVTVIQEMKDFVDGNSICEIIDCDTPQIYTSRRLNVLNTPQIDRHELGHLQLSEVLIVGNCYDQIRFSELSLDMYRMLQTFERDPRGQVFNSRNSRLSVADGLENGVSSSYPLDLPEVTNPHKYLLYKPTFSQFNSYVATAFKDLPASGALLLYISADGVRAPTVKTNNELNVGAAGYDYGGVVTNNRHEQEYSAKPKRVDFKEPHCIHPGDLLPYTRRPLFVIVDSDNSATFRSIPNLFGQPFVCLLSPKVIPEKLESQRHRGNLFTLFLHCPLTAFCLTCNLTKITLKTWDRAQSIIDSFLTECYQVLMRSRSLDYSYQQFLSDDFLRIIILRYCFCNIVLQLHRSFHGPSFYPSCSPSLPGSELIDCRVLHKLITELASLFDCRALFATADDYTKD